MKRRTNQRKAIEDVFIRNSRPLGVDEVLNEGREIIETLNQATVYRNIKLLVEKGWLIKVSHPELGARYERPGKEHHHFFHCRICNRLYDLPGCALKKDYSVAPGFEPQNHEIFFHGVCAECNG